jgi:hypothetical protein
LYLIPIAAGIIIIPRILAARGWAREMVWLNDLPFAVDNFESTMGNASVRRPTRTRRSRSCRSTTMGIAMVVIAAKATARLRVTL